MRRAPACYRLNRENMRSEEHTSELQSQSNLVCRLLLEKKKSTECLIHLPKLGSDATQFHQILSQTAHREMSLRLGYVPVAAGFAAQPVATTLLTFMRAS